MEYKYRIPEHYESENLNLTQSAVTGSGSKTQDNIPRDQIPRLQNPSHTFLIDILSNSGQRSTIAQGHYRLKPSMKLLNPKLSCVPNLSMPIQKLGVKIENPPRMVSGNAPHSTASGRNTPSHHRETEWNQRKLRQDRHQKQHRRANAKCESEQAKNQSIKEPCPDTILQLTARCSAQLSYCGMRCSKGSMNQFAKLVGLDCKLRDELPLPYHVAVPRDGRMRKSV